MEIGKIHLHREHYSAKGMPSAHNSNIPSFQYLLEQEINI